MVLLRLLYFVHCEVDGFEDNVQTVRPDTPFVVVDIQQISLLNLPVALRKLIHTRYEEVGRPVIDSSCLLLGRK